MNAGGIDTCGCIGGGVHSPAAGVAAAPVGSRVAGVRVVTRGRAFLIDEPCEQEREIMRLHAHARRRPAQHDTSIRLARLAPTPRR